MHSLPLNLEPIAYAVWVRCREEVDEFMTRSPKSNFIRYMQARTFNEDHCLFGDGRHSQRCSMTKILSSDAHARPRLILQQIWSIKWLASGLEIQLEGGDDSEHWRTLF
jgi:hypothetical protein